jgi:CRISPR-associated exonuclease Cas4
MARQFNPNQEDNFLEIGRLIHENAYLKEKKEIETSHMKIDLIRKENGKVVVGEIKKSSKFLVPSKMQLLFYLYRLKQKGIILEGELLIPKEKKRIPISLTEEYEEELKRAIKEIKELNKKDLPPPAEKISFCRNCAYNEFCWSEV